MTIQNVVSPPLLGGTGVKDDDPKHQLRHPELDQSDWRKIVVAYQGADTKKSVLQIINSFVPFFVLWVLMYFSLGVSYWLTLLLAIPAAGFVMRIFIIQHDCGHGSFFAKQKYNDIVGSICGVITLTPYYYWRKSHAIHHANSGKLEDYRGVGEIYTMTVEEYRAKSWWQQLAYRAYRHPITLFVFAPTLLFTIGYRFSSPTFAKKWKKEKASVLWTNIAILTVLVVMHFLIGLKAFLLVEMPIVIIVSTIGTWFFYIQHQFEDTYWEEAGDWEYSEAALRGSSYYKLPKILQWFSGNIGFHHVHHLSPRIPNYELQRAHDENPLLQEVTQLTIRSSVKGVSLNLWDENKKKLVTYKEATAT